MADKTYALILTVGATTTIMVAEDGAAVRTVTLTQYDKAQTLEIVNREFAAFNTNLIQKLS